VRLDARRRPSSRDYSPYLVDTAEPRGIVAAMFDLWAPEHSVLREKVVEHIFLAELSRSLLLDLAMPFEVLRSEFDAFGYDVVIDANGVLRHVQLKATTAAGARAHVDVQVALADKPSGCVVWIFVDPATFGLGPFLWFGGSPGEALPSLGERAVRHTRGDATGEKKVRAGLRRIPKGMFARFETMRELALAMFGMASDDHARLLRDHLARRGHALTLGMIPDDLTWESSADVAYMIDGYGLAEQAAIGDPTACLARMRRDAEHTGTWRGTALELWLALFLEHRRDHFQSGGAIGTVVDTVQPPLLDDLCVALAAQISTSQ
jgi:hypothetical protein